ncbi:putative quinol monooxygenase [Peribacillus kribbensis]|uniref:putative quinol monooxygenase n=1 Tax=Peribacillus kribbensis TaxID=356658 RepID=UPI0004212184|nr:putative quinol monooxygenase [Peribacillus kribbensis]
MAEITINAILKAKQGEEEALRAAMIKVLEPSRSEAGCIQYTLHESEEDAGVFVFYEKWKDDAALQAHIQSPHYVEYRAVTKDLLAEREVYRLRQI